MNLKIGLFEEGTKGKKDKKETAPKTARKGLPGGFLVYQDGRIAGSPDDNAVWIENPGPRLKYSTQALENAKHLCATICKAKGLDPISQIEGELRGIQMPSFRQGIKNVIVRSKKKDTEVY